MKKNEIKVGGKYVAKVSDKLTLVKITGVNPHGGWDATNEKTGKPIRIKSAQRLRSAVRDHAKETAEMIGHGREAAEARTEAAAPDATEAATLDQGATGAAEATQDARATKKAAREAAKVAKDAAKTEKAEKKAQAKAAKAQAKAEKAAARDTAKAAKAQAKAEKVANRKPSLLTLAAAVLKDATAPMGCKDIVLEVLAKTTWETQGKTPEATLYTAVTMLGKAA